MMRHIGLPPAFLISIIINASFANAEPADTKYTYYLIGGESAASLHLSMIKRGPRVGGGRAYASASMEPNVTLKTRSTGSTCRIENFKVNMTFTIRLPQLKKSARLNTRVRKSFQEFYSFAKRHEETHRSIWRSCARETEAIAQKVKARTCSQAEADAFKIFYREAKRCHARQVAFDMADKKRLHRIPFIKQAALRGLMPPSAD
jgi:predicted secreted Zn-dependent protease